MMIGQASADGLQVLEVSIANPVMSTYTCGHEKCSYTCMHRTVSDCFVSSIT